jgi:hypothetical protein
LARAGARRLATVRRAVVVRRVVRRAAVFFAVRRAGALRARALGFLLAAITISSVDVNITDGRNGRRCRFV